QSYELRLDRQWRVFDVDSGQTTTTGRGSHAQWLPGGQLIVGDWNEMVPKMENVQVFGADGAALGTFHFSSVFGPHAWLGDRLVTLNPLPWQVVTVDGYSAIDREAGLELEDPARGVRRTIVPTSEAPDRSAFASETVLLQWTQRCLGFYRTACTYQLHRLSLSDGGDQIIATTPQLAAFALSPDHKRVAIGTPEGIFVKDLP
ncbi:MAG TPA: hypothetical protein VN914_10035, partial [Polyangia bacterium]|nr:hypothetical protein [Polyangia bacterium]